MEHSVRAFGSVKQLSFLTLETVSKREEHKQQYAHHEIKVHVGINLYTTIVCSR